MDISDWVKDRREEMDHELLGWDAYGEAEAAWLDPVYVLSDSASEGRALGAAGSYGDVEASNPQASEPKFYNVCPLNNGKRGRATGILIHRKCYELLRERLHECDGVTDFHLYAFFTAHAHELGRAMRDIDYGSAGKNATQDWEINDHEMWMLCEPIARFHVPLGQSLAPRDTTSYGMLALLPLEIRLLIMRFLRNKELMRIQCVSNTLRGICAIKWCIDLTKRAFRYLASAPELWRVLLESESIGLHEMLRVKSENPSATCADYWATKDARVRNTIRIHSTLHRIVILFKKEQSLPEAKQKASKKVATAAPKADLVSDLHGPYYVCVICNKDLSCCKLPGRLTHVKDRQKKHKVSLEVMETLVAEHKKRPPVASAKKEMRSKFFATGTRSHSQRQTTQCKRRLDTIIKYTV